MKLTPLARRCFAAAISCTSLLALLFVFPANGAHANILNVKNYGAKGDGKTDDTAAIKKTIAAAKVGDTIYFPIGNYLHSTYLSFKSILVTGDGATKSFITATSTYNGALQFLGSKVSISKVCVQYAHPSDSIAYLANGIWINQVTTFTVNSVTVRNVSANGVSVGKSHSGTISASRISSPTETGVFLADSTNMNVSQNTFPLTSTAVYVNNSNTITSPQNITIASNHIQNSSGYTGTPAIYVVGLNHCSITNNSVNNNIWGGILVQGDNIAGFGKTSYVTVSGNTFSNCALLGNIYVESSNDGSPSPVLTVTQVSITNNTMKTNNPSFSIITIGDIPDTMSGVTISQNDVENVPTAPGIYVDNTGNATVTNNTIKQTGFGSIWLGPGNNGAFVVDSNTMQDCGPNSGGVLPSSNDAVVDLEPALDGGTSLTSVEIKTNSYSGSVTGLVDFIYDGAPAHLLTSDVVLGNTTTTTLPNYIAP
jgi:parallel beta-helix repeat protein